MGSLTVAFVIIELVIWSQRPLVPGLMLLCSFILLVLYITGIVETAVQLFGPGNVSSNCSTFVSGQSKTGVSLVTLAWLEENTICKLFCDRGLYKKC